MPTSLILRLFAFFDPDTVVLLGKVCVRLRAVYRWFSNHVWNPSKIYQDWFVDYAGEFRSQLHHTGAIVSGSFALQFFDRVTYPASDMDIFVRTGGAPVLCKWITARGYRYGNELSDTYYGDSVDGARGALDKCVTNCSSFENAVLAVHNFFKLVEWRDGSVHLMHVQVVVVDLDPIEHMLFDFHSTAVMNFITANEAVSVFPKATLVEKVSYITKIRVETEERCQRWKKKYSDRGYRMVGSEQFPPSKSLVLGPRHAIDRHSWVLRFVALPRERPLYGPRKLDVRFDVMTRESGVVAPGSHIRISEPYIWRNLSSLVTESSKGKILLL